MKWYLAGPMSGIPQFNLPLFHQAAADLRERDYDLISPAELDDPDVTAAAWASPDGDPAKMAATLGMTWGGFLSRDVKIVADQVQGLIFLPGWEHSRGAKLEAYVGLLCGHEFRVVAHKFHDDYNTWRDIFTVSPLSAASVRRAL